MIVGLIHALRAGGEGVTGAHEAEHAAERYRRCFGGECRRPGWAGLRHRLSGFLSILRLRISVGFSVHCRLLSPICLRLSVLHIWIRERSVLGHHEGQ